MKEETDDKQEYLYNDDYVTISNKIVGEDDLVVVVNDHEEYLVARKSNLKKKEDSWGYKRSLERNIELEQLTANAEKNLDKMADKLVDKALKSLASRLKFNTMFGKGTTSSEATLAFTITNELEKMIKEEAPEAIKKKEDF